MTDDSVGRVTKKMEHSLDTMRLSQNGLLAFSSSSVGS